MVWWSVRLHAPHDIDASTHEKKKKKKRRQIFHAA